LAAPPAENAKQNVGVDLDLHLLGSIVRPHASKLTSPALPSRVEDRGEVFALVISRSMMLELGRSTTIALSQDSRDRDRRLCANVHRIGLGS